MAKAKILIVDDEKNIVEAIRYNLEREGFRTLIAADGQRALELAQRELPDLITLDVMLPEHDGGEVCRRLVSPARVHRRLTLNPLKAPIREKFSGRGFCFSGAVLQ